MDTDYVVIEHDPESEDRFAVVDSQDQNVVIGYYDNAADAMRACNFANGES